MTGVQIYGIFITVLLVGVALFWAIPNLRKRSKLLEVA